MGSDAHAYLLNMWRTLISFVYLSSLGIQSFYFWLKRIFWGVFLSNTRFMRNWKLIAYWETYININKHTWNMDKFCLQGVQYHGLWETKPGNFLLCNSRVYLSHFSFWASKKFYRISQLLHIPYGFLSWDKRNGFWRDFKTIQIPYSSSIYEIKGKVIYCLFTRPNIQKLTTTTQMAIHILISWLWYSTGKNMFIVKNLGCRENTMHTKTIGHNREIFTQNVSWGEFLQALRIEK